MTFPKESSDAMVVDIIDAIVTSKLLSSVDGGAASSEGRLASLPLMVGPTALATAWTPWSRVTRSTPRKGPRTPMSSANKGTTDTKTIGGGMTGA